MPTPSAPCPPTSSVHATEPARSGRLPRVKTWSLALALAVSACSSPAAPAAAPAVAARAELAAPERLARRWLGLSPSLARDVGLHEYDGKGADLSAAGIE